MPADPTPAWLALMYAQTRRFLEGFRDLMNETAQIKRPESLTALNPGMHAEFEGRTTAFGRVMALIQSTLSTLVVFEPGDPVTILGPDGYPLRFGKVVETPQDRRDEPDAHERVYVCWDGNPPHRLFSFLPGTSQVMNLKDINENDDTFPERLRQEYAQAGTGDD